MLILTRKIGETLMVGEEVTVTGMGVKGNQVRIGINAPRDWRFIERQSMTGFNRKERNRNSGTCDPQLIADEVAGIYLSKKAAAKLP